MACKGQKETRCRGLGLLCCLRRKLLWPEVQSVPATQRNTGHARTGQLATPRAEPTPPQVHARDMRCSRAGEGLHRRVAAARGPATSPWLAGSQARRSPKAEPHRPETRSFFLLRCVRSVECLCLQPVPVCKSAPPMPSLPAGQHYLESHACRNTERCRHSSGWLGSTQGKIVRCLV